MGSGVGFGATHAKERKRKRTERWSNEGAQHRQQRLVGMERYDPCSTFNSVELPINPAARPTYPPGVVSATVWSASPTGQVGQSVQSFCDATVAERQNCAANAKPLP